MTPAELLAENDRRLAAINAEFDPVSGSNSTGRRFRMVLPDLVEPELYLPESMRQEPVVSYLVRHGSVGAAAAAFRREYGASAWSVDELSSQMLYALMRVRIRHDFPYWGACFVRIKSKGGGPDTALVLNRPQRRLVERLEEFRLAGEPVRLILLKARQWGGSTCVQVYMAWLQLVHACGLNSLIIAHQGAGSDEIKAMFDRLMESYRADLLCEPGERPSPRERKIVGVGKSGSIFRVPRRKCTVKIGTAERPDACRGGDYNLVHLSEVGIWRATAGKCPEDIVRSATSGILYRPMTMIVLESTANGRGNYFHREYLAARSGESQFRPLFVAWHEIDAYSLPFASAAAREEFARELLEKRDETVASDRRESGAYHWRLWQMGATLEAINWYRAERAKYSEHSRMASEYPSDDVEAFAHSGSPVFAAEYVEALGADAEPPFFRGEVSYDDASRFRSDNVRFFQDSSGNLAIWRLPETDVAWSGRYLTVVDVGGRSDKADWSVVAVFDRAGPEGVPEVVAQWRGHTDHDRLARTAASIAAFYCDSLLVFESNTLESARRGSDSDGNMLPYILDVIGDAYPNLYVRSGPGGVRPGFHTNVQTKTTVINNLIDVVRDHGYRERCAGCIDEFAQYERRPGGSYGAVAGCHDDMLMTRAIGLYISGCEMDPPRRLASRSRSFRSRPAGPASEACF